VHGTLRIVRNCADGTGPAEGKLRSSRETGSRPIRLANIIEESGAPVQFVGIALRAALRKIMSF